METMRSSVLCRALAPLWFLLTDCYDKSLLAKLIRGIARGLKNWCAGSALVGFVTREGSLTRAWKESLLCRVLLFLVNIPTRVCRGSTASCRGYSRAAS